MVDPAGIQLASSSQNGKCLKSFLRTQSGTPNPAVDFKVTCSLNFVRNVLFLYIAKWFSHTIFH